MKDRHSARKRHPVASGVVAVFLSSSLRSAVASHRSRPLGPQRGRRLFLLRGVREARRHRRLIRTKGR